MTEFTIPDQLQDQINSLRQMANNLAGANAKSAAARTDALADQMTRFRQIVREEIKALKGVWEAVEMNAEGNLSLAERDQIVAQFEGSNEL